MQGGRREIDVAAAPGDDHVGTQVEQLDERVHTADRDDPRRLVDFFGGQRGKAAQALELAARREFAFEKVLGNFRIEIAQLEFRDAVLDREFADHAHEMVDAVIAAGVARRADDERDALLARGRQEQLQLFAGEMAQRHIGS